MRRLAENELNYISPEHRNVSPEREAHSLEFFRFVNKQKIFDDFSEIEKRIQQTNRKVKSAIRQVEYTVKPQMF